MHKRLNGAQWRARTSFRLIRLPQIRSEVFASLQALSSEELCRRHEVSLCQLKLCRVTKPQNITCWLLYTTFPSFFILVTVIFIAPDIKLAQNKS